MSVSTRKLQVSALRNLSLVSVHKAAQMVGQLLAVVTIPRLLGADDHGRLAFVLAFAYVAQILGDFGTLEVMSRFVPTLTGSEVGRLYNRTLAFKIIVGLVCGVVTAGLAMLLSHWMRLDWAILFGIGVAAHIIGWVPFQLLLGLNHVGHWMVEQSWRQGVLVVLLVALYPWLGLSGAMLAWALMELAFCGMGFWWTRSYFEKSELIFSWSYMRPYVQFGIGFFLANLIAALLYRSGPVLIESLTGQSAQAGYLNLALGLYLMPYLLLTQMALSLVPPLSNLYIRGERAQMQQWLNNFVRYSWLIGCLGPLSVWLTASWAVPLVFGPGYEPAIATLKVISLAIPLSALVWTGNAVANVTGRGQVKFWATVGALLVFLGLSFFLAPLYGATGAAIALCFAIGVNTAVLTIFLYPDLTLQWPLLIISSVAGVALLGAITSYGL
jgi:O-antigen/teichoic acid export membrane protein